MRKIRFKFSADPLHGRIEIAELQRWEFFPDQIHQLPDTKAFPGFRDSGLAKVPVGIDIEISPLDHGEVCLPDQPAQRLVFFHAVGHAGKNKIVDGGPAPKATHDFEAVDDVFERIIIGAVIGGVDRSPRRVQAHPDRIQPGLAKGPDGLGFAAVGVDIDATPGRVAAHFADGFAEGLPHQQGFSLAALTEADDGVWGCLQVRHREFDDLFRCRPEGQPVLGGRDGFFLRLEGNAADAVGIAGR